MYEDWYLRRAELEGMLEHRDGGIAMEQVREIQKEIAALTRALGEEVESEDDLIDRWEKELADGKTPDLTEGLKRAD